MKRKHLVALGVTVGCLALAALLIQLAVHPIVAVLFTVITAHRAGHLVASVEAKS